MKTAGEKSARPRPQEQHRLLAQMAGSRTGHDLARKLEQAAPSPAAVRQRRHRHRVHSGRAVFRVELGVLDVELYLVGAGLLRPGDVDRSTIEAALARLLERLITAGGYA